MLFFRFIHKMRQICAFSRFKPFICDDFGFPANAQIYAADLF